MPHKWTEDDLKQVKNRVQGGVGGGGIDRNSLRGQAHQDSRERRLRTENGRKLVPNPAPAPSLSKWAPYKSKLEYNFAQRLALEQKAGVIDGWLYEPFSFMLASGRRYRVDFIAWKWTSLNGKDFQYVTTCFEVKGWHRNYRAAMVQLSWAAQRFPFFQWRKVVSNGKRGFEVMEVRV